MCRVVGEALEAAQLAEGLVDFDALVDATSTPSTSTVLMSVTVGYERLFEDPEFWDSAIAAKHLGIPIRVIPRDREAGASLAPSGRVHDARGRRDLLPIASFTEGYRVASAHSRVVLYGEGPDNLLTYEWQPHLRHLQNQGRWFRAGRDVTAHVRSHRRVPLLSSIPAMLRERRPAGGSERRLPDWLGRNIIERLEMERRWTHRPRFAPVVHPLRPIGYESLQTTGWQRLFRGVNMPEGPATLEIRYPYLDIRLVRFMLQLPAMPWCRKKYLFRCAFKGLLPDTLLQRPKTPLPVWPDHVLAERLGLPRVVPSSRLANYWEPHRFPNAMPKQFFEFHLLSRFVALSHWLFGLDSRSMQPMFLQEETLV